MGYQTHQGWRAEAWQIARRQHGVIARSQLLALGVHPQAIKHRVTRGRLHPVWRGVYAVGRPQLGRLGRWMGAVLACGPGAALSHKSAAALWGIREGEDGDVHVSIPPSAARRRPGVVVHRRALAAADVTGRHGIPVTTPICTLIDLATQSGRDGLEAAINAADKRELVDPETLRIAIDRAPPRPGVGVLRRTLDGRTFTLTDSELERRFLPIAAQAGLPMPESGQYVNGFKVDFHWPELRLIVETDGLRYHRTAAQQARDRLRDQVHTAAGFRPLRFTHAQVTFEPNRVRAILATVARRLRPVPTD